MAPNDISRILSRLDEMRSESRSDIGRVHSKIDDLVTRTGKQQVSIAVIEQRLESAITHPQLVDVVDRSIDECRSRRRRSIPTWEAIAKAALYLVALLALGAAGMELGGLF